MDDGAGSEHDGSARPGLVALGGLTVTLAVVRLVFALRAESLTSLPDEIGFLGDAWLLGRGEPAPPMGWAPFYKGAYPLLLAPVAVLTDDTATLATAARVLDVALLALLAPLVWVLLGRLGRLTPTARALTAVAGTALPGLWVAGVRAWPDALLAVGWVGALLALGPLLDARAAVWRRLWFGPLVAALAAAHDRFLPVAGLGAVLLVVRVLLPPPAPGAEVDEVEDADGDEGEGADPDGDADVGVDGDVAVDDGEEAARPGRGVDLANLALALAVVVGGLVLDARVGSRWDRIADDALGRLADAPADTLAAMVGSLVGQLWYACVATFGLAPVGAATLGRVVRRAWERPRALWTEPLPATALAALVGAAAVQVAAALQIGDGEAFGDVPVFDLVANGRYQEVVLVPLVVVGVARLARRRARSLRLELGVAAVVVALAAVATVALGTRPTVLDPGSAAGTTWLVEMWPARPVVAPTFVALCVLAGFVLLRPPPEARVGALRAACVPLLAMAALCVPGVDATAQLVADSRSRARVPDLAAVRDEADGAPIAYALDAATVGAAAPVAWALAGEDLETYEPSRQEAPAALVIAPADGDDPAVAGLEDAEEVLRLGGRDLLGRPFILWRLPAP